MKTILAFSASNSAHSINLQLLNTAIEKISAHSVLAIDIRDYPMPMYSIDKENDEGFPETTRELHAQFAVVDAFIFAIPEHNGSMPAVFKNTMDWLSRVGNRENPLLGGKPVLLLSTSPGPRGGATNLQTLTHIMPFWGADIRGSFSLGSFYEHFSDSQLSAEKEQQLNRVVQDLVGSL